MQKDAILPEQQEKLDNHDLVWRPAVIAGGLGPVGLGYWGYRLRHSVPAYLVVIACVIWFAQVGISFWILPSGMPRLGWAFHFVFANLAVIIWLMAVSLYPKDSSGGIFPYLLGHSLHFFALQSWLVVFFCMSQKTPEKLHFVLLLAFGLGASWCSILPLALKHSPRVFRPKKPFASLLLGWIFAIGVGGTAAVFYVVLLTILKPR